MLNWWVSERCDSHQSPERGPLSPIPPLVRGWKEFAWSGGRASAIDYSESMALTETAEQQLAPSLVTEQSFDVICFNIDLLWCKDME